MKAAYKGDRPLLEDEAEAVIAKPDAEIFTLRVKTLEVGYLAKILGGFDLFDYLLNSSQQPGVSENGQILFKGFTGAGCQRFLCRNWS